MYDLLILLASLAVFVIPISLVIYAAMKKKWRLTRYAAASFAFGFVLSAIAQGYLSDEAEEAGFASIERYEKAQSLGFETPEELKSHERKEEYRASEFSDFDLWEKAQRLGFESKANFDAAMDGGFSDRQEWSDASEGGFQDAGKFRDARDAGFENAELYEQFRAGGFHDVEEFQAAQGLGIEDADEYRRAKDAGVKSKEDLREHRAAQEKQDCMENLRCWAQRNISFAVGPCENAVQRLAKYQIEWTVGWLGSKFTHFQWYDKKKKQVTYIGDKVKFQNGFGAWQHYAYQCAFDTEKREVIEVSAEPGRLP